MEINSIIFDRLKFVYFRNLCCSFILKELSLLETAFGQIWLFSFLSLWPCDKIINSECHCPHRAALYSASPMEAETGDSQLVITFIISSWLSSNCVTHLLYNCLLNWLCSISNSKDSLKSWLNLYCKDIFVVYTL